MSKIAVALLLTAAVAVGASAGLALKPASKPQQAVQPQQAAPLPMQVVAGNCPSSDMPASGSVRAVATGVIPTGPGVPTALAGYCWLFAGGDLCWPGPANPAITHVPGQSIFPGMLAGSEIAFIPDPANKVVYFTICKFG